MTLNDFKSQNREFYGFFGDFGLRHKSVSFTRWRHVTIVRPMRSRERIWYLYINLAWTPQFSAKLLNWNSYRLSRVSWALAQISFKMWSRKRWVMCTGSTFQEWRCKSQQGGAYFRIYELQKRTWSTVLKHLPWLDLFYLRDSFLTLWAYYTIGVVASLLINKNVFFYILLEISQKITLS